MSSLAAAQSGRAPRAVAVLRFSALGDVVLAAPALAALKAAWPATRVVVAVKQRYEPVLGLVPAVDEVVALAPGEGVRSLAGRLRRAGAEAVLDLHGKLRSRALGALLADLPASRIARRSLRERVLVGLNLVRAQAHQPVVDRYHAAVERLVGRRLSRQPLSLRLPPGAADLTPQFWATRGLDPSRPLLGLSPGAAWATKRWPPDRFAALARRALAEGLQVAVQGGPDEARLVAQVVAAAPGAVDLSGQLDLRALASFLARCTAFAGNDSGPLHIARGLGVPCLAIFGSTDPGLFDFSGHAVARVSLPCSPCSFFGRDRCPQGHFRCMNDLTVEAVWHALVPQLRGGRRLPVLS